MKPAGGWLPVGILSCENSSIVSGQRTRSLKFKFCSSANSPHCVFSFVVEVLVTLRLRNVPHTS